jgi:hypothetical protein
LAKLKINSKIKIPHSFSIFLAQNFRQTGISAVNLNEHKKEIKNEDKIS